MAVDKHTEQAMDNVVGFAAWVFFAFLAVTFLSGIWFVLTS